MSASFVWRLVWLDRAGKEIKSAQRLDAAWPRPHFERWAQRALRSRLGSYDLFLYDIERAIEQRLTSEPTSEQGGVWLSAGRAIYSGEQPLTTVLDWRSALQK